MQVNETLADGLRRELEVTIPAADLSEKLDTYLNDMKTKVRLNGFRPGKVPVSHLKRVYGKQAMAEIVNDAVTETIRTTLEERSEKPAMQPEIDVADGVAEGAMAGGADFVFKLQYEIMPTFEVIDFSQVKLERPVADVADEEIDDQIKAIAEGNRPYEAREDGSAAESGDQVTIDFVGKIGDEPFEGGAGEDVPLVIGSGRFIPGFEDQLIGTKAGDEKVVTVTFPEEYGEPKLAGQEATFDTKVKAVAAPGEVTIDDEFAKTLGLEDLAKLKELVTNQIQDQYKQASRRKVKRKLLDHLDEVYAFDLPPKLLDSEFEIIWKQVLADMEQSGKTFAEEGSEEGETEEKSRADYLRIAARRVRLGLVLSEVGEKNDVQVSEEETKQALFDQARQFPGQEAQVFEYYKNNAQALASLRGPLYEEKVIDYILELADVTDVSVPKDELLAADEDDDSAVDSTAA